MAGMNTHRSSDSENPTDEHIIETLQKSADAEEVFVSTREWSLDKIRASIHSRGDFFDRNSELVLEMDDREVFRACMCQLPSTIGRGEKADFRLNYEGVSRVHCRLEPRGNLIRLIDVGSKNGTWLNGKRIDSEDLCDGDQIEIGSVALRAKRV